MKIIARQAGGNGAFKVNLDHYRSDEGASEFTRLLSGAFSSHKQQGCVAFLSVDAEDARLISLSAWHAGWKVMLLPESLEADKLIAIGKDVDILVCRKPGQQQALQKLAPVVLCLEDDDEDGDTLLSWLTNQTNFAEGSGHSWSESEPALVLFTSGSTGLPKGVCHSISNIVASAKRFIEHFDLGDNDILFNTAPLHMISGFRGSVLLPFFSKLSVTTLDGEANPDNIIRILQRDRPTTMITGPNIVRQLSMLTAKLSDHTRSLRAIFSTGAKLDRDCRTKIYRDLNIPVLDYYGTTETGGCVIGEFADDYRPQSMAMGKSCVNVRLRLIDGNKSRKFGEGELRIYTDSIFLGYGGSELKPNEFYDTGDHVSISKKGDVTWLHRLKSGIKSTSTGWIYSETVDSWLRESNKKIDDLYVRPYYDEYDRPGFEVKVSGVSSAKWDSWCQSNQRRLRRGLGSEYDRIRWVRVDGIKRSSLGKILD